MHPCLESSGRHCLRGSWRLAGSSHVEAAELAGSGCQCSERTWTSAAGQHQSSGREPCLLGGDAAGVHRRRGVSRRQMLDRRDGAARQCQSVTVMAPVGSGVNIFVVVNGGGVKNTLPFGAAGTAAASFGQHSCAFWAHCWPRDGTAVTYGCTQGSNARVRSGRTKAEPPVTGIRTTTALPCPPTVDSLSLKAAPGGGP